MPQWLLMLFLPCGKWSSQCHAMLWVKSTKRNWSVKCFRLPIEGDKQCNFWLHLWFIQFAVMTYCFYFNMLTSVSYDNHIVISKNTWLYRISNNYIPALLRTVNKTKWKVIFVLISVFCGHDLPGSGWPIVLLLTFLFERNRVQR